MSLKVVYLIINAQQKVRVATRLTYLKPSEVAIAIGLKFPDTWGKVVATVEATVPDMAPEVEHIDPVVPTDLEWEVDDIEDESS